MLTLEQLVALGRLDPRDREMFVDYALLGMTQHEIARRDDVTHSMAWIRIDRARKQLAVELA
jgi:DNA-directed RNA polymerase specialized sigma24 family protein